MQSEAKSLRTLILSDQDITSSFQDDLVLVKSLITKESYDVAEEKIQLLQKDIDSNKILADYQSEVTKLAEQVHAALQSSEQVKQNETGKNEENSTSKETNNKLMQKQSRIVPM